MATTMKINNGDVMINTSTGRPKLIGNITGESDAVKAKEKAVQDIRGGVATNRLRSGAGAGINELVGLVPIAGSGAVSIMLSKQIRDMFAAILRLQGARPTIRPTSEQFSRITSLIVTPVNQDNVSFNFRLDTRTVAGETIRLSGTVVP